MSIATPRIGYDSIFFATSVTVSVTNETTGFEGSNAYNWNPSQRWKPGVAANQNLQAYVSVGHEVDYIGIYGHNLGTTGASYSLQYGSTGTDWTDYVASTSPSDDTVIFSIVSISATHPYWRLHLTSVTNSTIISQAAIGKTLEIPAEYGLGLGFTPPNLSNMNEYYNPMSDKGVPLGRSVKRYAGESEINLSLIDPAWIRNTWKPFIDHTDTYPFFFSWDYINYPTECAFCWTNTRGSTDPDYSEPNLMSTSIKFNVLVT